MEKPEKRNLEAVLEILNLFESWYEEPYLEIWVEDLHDSSIWKDYKQNSAAMLK